MSLQHWLTKLNRAISIRYMSNAFLIPNANVIMDLTFREGDYEMKVIAGSAHGHNLKSIGKLKTVRPTACRIKESLFNIISPYVDDAMVLDLYSGTGAIGIEALSRGALHCTFVERDRACVDVIKHNLTVTKLIERADVVHGDAISSLRNLKCLFDIIFLDPPYHFDLVQKTLEQISKLNLLTPNGFVIAEQASDEPLPNTVLDIFRIKRYNSTSMIFLR